MSKAIGRSTLTCTCRPTAIASTSSPPSSAWLCVHTSERSWCGRRAGVRGFRPRLEPAGAPSTSATILVRSGVESRTKASGMRSSRRRRQRGSLSASRKSATRRFGRSSTPCAASWPGGDVRPGAHAAARKSKGPLRSVQRSRSSFPPTPRPAPTDYDAPDRQRLVVASRRFVPAVGTARGGGQAGGPAAGVPAPAGRGGGAGARGPRSGSWGFWSCLPAAAWSPSGPPARARTRRGVLSGDMDDFELEAVGIAKEHGVVAGVVVVIGGRVEDVGAELEEHVVDAVHLVAIDSVQCEVMKPGREKVVRGCVAMRVGDRRQDQPLTTGRRIAPLPRSPVVVAGDLHPSELGEQCVLEAFANRRVTDTEAQVIERAGGAHTCGVPRQRRRATARDRAGAMRARGDTPTGLVGPEHSIRWRATACAARPPVRTAPATSAAPSLRPEIAIDDVLEAGGLTFAHRPQMHKRHIQPSSAFGTAAKVPYHREVIGRVDPLFGVRAELLEVLGDAGEDIVRHALRAIEGAGRGAAPSRFRPPDLGVHPLHHGGYARGFEGFIPFLHRLTAFGSHSCPPGVALGRAYSR